MRGILRAGINDSRIVCETLGRFLNERPDLQTIAVFSALPGEPDLTELIAQQAARRWAYPRVEGADLVFHQVTDPPTQLQSGAFGILEPSPTLPRIDITAIDAFVCPGLAFDPRGGRLGRGRGFYDRMLAAARPDALKIGVCFPGQIVPDTFPESHDIPMNLVIS
jgi:5-formyltetrahydrofolate cyclo-ligase